MYKVKKFFQITKFQLTLFVKEKRNIVAIFVPIFFIVLLGSIEGEARAVATVVTSTILSTALFRLKGSFVKIDTNIVGNQLKKDSSTRVVLFANLFYVLIIIYVSEFIYIFSGFFFTEVVDIMNGNVIKYGDINWQMVNFFYVIWAIFLTSIVNASIAYVLYAIAIRTNGFYALVSMILIILTVIMNIGFSDYLVLDPDTGIYSANIINNWLGPFWLLFPTFWANSVTLKTFTHFGDFIYNPFLVGHYADSLAKTFQILFIVMPWIITLLFTIMGLIIQRSWKQKMEYTR